jgi:hypothetical protein
VSEPDPIALLSRLRQSRPALIKAAAQILAATPGAAEHILASHHATDTGHCARCSDIAPVWWPCTPVNIAWVAQITTAGRPSPQQHDTARGVT